MMSVSDFDDRYRREGDPWSYRDSAYEQAKYGATLRACGPGPFVSALELGASIGIFSAQLAPRCEHLRTVDFSAVAVAQARRELSGQGHVDVQVGEIPWALDEGRYDLVVASEVLYYLAPPALEATLAWLARAVAEKGRIVLVHWRSPGPERPFSAEEVHDRVLGQPWLRLSASASTADYLLDVAERR